MGLFSKKPKEPKRTLQDDALEALEANTVKLPVAALENESYSTGGSYMGKPKKAQQDTLEGFLARKKATREYPEITWEGVAMLQPDGSGNVLVVVDSFAIDQLTKAGAKAFLGVSTEPVPVWCQIQIMGKGPYRRFHTVLMAKRPKPKAPKA